MPSYSLPQEKSQESQNVRREDPFISVRQRHTPGQSTQRRIARHSDCGVCDTVAPAVRAALRLALHIGEREASHRAGREAIARLRGAYAAGALAHARR